MAIDDATDLIGVEHFSGQQRVGDVRQFLLVLGQQQRAALVLVADDLLDLSVDLQRRVLAVGRALGDLAAQEDLLFFLTKGQRAH